jgi:hypothetical protein
MGLQQLFIVVFLGFMIAFQKRCCRGNTLSHGKRCWRPLLFGLYGVMVCITVSLPLC